MKTKFLLLLLIASFVGIGCSNKNESATPPVSTDPIVQPPVADAGVPAGGGTDGGLTSTSGDTVDFVPVDFNTFNSYVGTHPLNSPKNIKLQVNLKDNGSLRFYGSVKISYEDNGQTWAGNFESGDGKNQSIASLKDNDEMESKFSYWFKNNGVTVFSGIYQDQLGSVVIVVDKSVNQGDGQGASFVSGSVYYKNFAQSFATQSPYRKCWYIYAGPHDCRTSTVQTKSGLYPTTSEGYRKLGTFTGLSRVKAFNL